MMIRLELTEAEARMVAKAIEHYGERGDRNERFALERAGKKLDLVRRVAKADRDVRDLEAMRKDEIDRRFDAAMGQM
jgi:hypothetical protein